MRKFLNVNEFSLRLRNCELVQKSAIQEKSMLQITTIPILTNAMTCQTSLISLVYGQNELYGGLYGRLYYVEADL